MKAFEPFKNYNYSHPDDMEEILRYLSDNGKINVSTKKIESLYYDFCGGMFSSSWVSVSDETLEMFVDYLSEIEV